MKRFNKQILEAINKGIQLALDDYQDLETNNSISQYNDVINSEENIKNQIEFNKNFVDLGLPSGTIWAKYNLGVDLNKLNTPKDWYGNYYAWGETETKPSFRWENYKWFEKWANDPVLTKYIVSGLNNKYNGKTPDNFSQILLEDDAAYIQSNGEMITPTKNQLKELLFNTSSEYIENYNNIKNLNGFIFKSLINKNELFIPLSGYKSTFDDTIRSPGVWTHLWSSTPCERSHNAYVMTIIKGDAHGKISSDGRANGFSIRPVKNIKETQFDSELESNILELYEEYKNLTIQSQELKRLMYKHYVNIDKNFLQRVLSKRVYNNIMGCVGNEHIISYDKFYEIMKKHNCKLYGGKKFKYPEIDFSPIDPR